MIPRGTHKRLGALHDLPENCKDIMLDILGVKDHFDRGILAQGSTFNPNIDRFAFDHPDNRGRNLVHSLPIANILIQLAENEQNV
jgi:hypothetical protein